MYINIRIVSHHNTSFDNLHFPFSSLTSLFLIDLSWLILMDPPFNEIYKNLLFKQITNTENNVPQIPFSFSITAVVEVVELPVIDVSRLIDGAEKEREICKEEIARASREWGFFQVINHGISMDVLEKMRQEQIRVFREPFDKKSKSERFSAGSYRWGTPSATCLRQLSWSEAFHVPMTDISDNKDFTTLRYTDILTDTNFR